MPIQEIEFNILFPKQTISIPAWSTVQIINAKSDALLEQKTSLYFNLYRNDNLYPEPTQKHHIISELGGTDIIQLNLAYTNQRNTNHNIQLEAVIPNGVFDGKVYYEFVPISEEEIQNRLVNVWRMNNTDSNNNVISSGFEFQNDNEYTRVVITHSTPKGFPTFGQFKIHKPNPSKVVVEMTSDKSFEIKSILDRDLIIIHDLNDASIESHYERIGE